MPRQPRVTVGGMVYHVWNRGNGRMQLFSNDADYEAFEHVIGEAQLQVSMRLLAYCVMPNHWHLVLHPHENGELSRFMKWLTVTHTQRWHLHRGTTGLGHIYQGRFKSFPVELDHHFLTLCRYVERNPFQAQLVRRAEDWRWSSLARRLTRISVTHPQLSEWPVQRPSQWLELLNQPLTHAEVTKLELAMARGRPLGSDAWQQGTAKELGLESTIRPRGRPKKGSDPFYEIAVPRKGV